MGEHTSGPGYLLRKLFFGVSLSFEGKLSVSSVSLWRTSYCEKNTESTCRSSPHACMLAKCTQKHTIRRCVLGFVFLSLPLHFHVVSHLISHLISRISDLSCVFSSLSCLSCLTHLVSLSFLFLSRDPGHTNTKYER